MKNLNEGRSDISDVRKLRLWNMICLCHLQFAVGTGRPSVIATEYLEHCDAILKTTQVTLYDEITVAAVNLFASVQDLLRQNSLSDDHSRKQMRAWSARWGYLLDATDGRISVLQVAIDFCHLVLDKRCMEHLAHQSTRLTDRLTLSPNEQHHESSPLSNRERSSVQSTNLRERHVLLCREHALQVLNTFRNLPPARTEEIPEFLYLCVIYAMIVLVELYNERRGDPDNEDIPTAIRETLSYALKAVSGVTISFELIGGALDEFLGNFDAQQPAHPRPHQPNMDAPAPDLFSFPQLEDIFTGSYADTFWGYQQPEYG